MCWAIFSKNDDVSYVLPVVQLEYNTYRSNTLFYSEVSGRALGARDIGLRPRALGPGPLHGTSRLKEDTRSKCPAADVWGL